MRIVFDLDHTLFKTNLFKKDFFKLFVLAGTDDFTIRKTYQKHLKEEGGAYDFKKHCSEIKKSNVKFKESFAIALFEKFLANTDFSRYIERGCLKFLKEQKTAGSYLVLLTKGGDELQRIKIEKTGFLNVFDEISICKDTKLDKIKELKLGKYDFFINDLCKETLEIRERFPLLRFVMLDIENHKKRAKKCSSLKLDDIPIINSIRNLESVIEKTRK